MTPTRPDRPRVPTTWRRPVLARVFNPCRVPANTACLLLPILISACAAPVDVQPAAPPAPAIAPATTRPDYDHAAGAEDDAETWRQIAAAFGREGVLKDGVYTLAVPRDDLQVDIEGMPVPAGAGVASEFHFYRCPCGKIIAIGQFCLTDYEVNDVIDALREGHVAVASLGPMLLYGRPRVVLLRYQGEGRGGELAKAIRAALSWTGPERLGGAPPAAPPAPAPATRE